EDPQRPHGVFWVVGPVGRPSRERSPTAGPTEPGAVHMPRKSISAAASTSCAHTAPGSSAVHDRGVSGCRHPVGSAPAQGEPLLAQDRVLVVVDPPELTVPHAAMRMLLASHPDLLQHPPGGGVVGE